MNHATEEGPPSTLSSVARDMQRMYEQHKQPAGDVVDLALDLLEQSGWESWPADGGTRQALAFKEWKGNRGYAEAYGDPQSARDFPIWVRAVAISQCIPSIRIGLARSALICMHGFLAQARASFRATVEECLYAFMLMQDVEHARLYLADHDGLWRQSVKLRRRWEAALQKDGAEPPDVPPFGHVLAGIYQKHIHSGSHGGFTQAAHRTRGTTQTFVDANSPRLGAYSVAFAGAVLRLVDALVPLHPQVNREYWQLGLTHFEHQQRPILATLLQPRSVDPAGRHDGADPGPSATPV